MSSISGGKERHLIRLGLAQMDMAWEAIEENKAKVEHFLAKAGEKGTDLVVFPEMTMTGFSMNTALSEYYEDQKDFFSRKAAEYGISIIYGVIAPGKEKRFENHLVMVDEKGNCLMEYAKIHPFTYGAEGKYYSGGDKVYVSHWHDTCLSGFVCYDLRFPQIFQAVSGEAEMIVVIANWPKERIDHWDTLLRARAIENSCYVVGVNRAGTAGRLDYSGHSAVYDYLGKRITPPVEEEDLILAEIATETVGPFRDSFPLLKDRRPDLYRNLIIERKGSFL